MHSILPFCWFFGSHSTVKLTNQVHGLSKEQLAARQVEYIDIAFPGSDCWSHLVGKCNVDYSKFKSARTGRGPLLKGWQVGISLHIFIFVNEIYLECIVLILLFPFFEGRLFLTFYLFILCSDRVPRSLTSLHTRLKFLSLRWTIFYMLFLFIQPYTIIFAFGYNYLMDNFFFFLKYWTAPSDLHVSQTVMQN